MPGFVIHIAIGNEYLRKHNILENKDDFIQGNIQPDLAKDKTKTHYGKSPTYTNLKEFLKYNELNSPLNRGIFLHLIADYLFYNYYLKDVPREGTREILHSDYDIINKDIIKKYNVTLLENIKQSVFYKTGTTKILTLDLVYKVIDEISNLDIDVVREEILNNNEKWSTYKQI